MLSAREMALGFATMWIDCEARRPIGEGIVFGMLILYALNGSERVGGDGELMMLTRRVVAPIADVPTQYLDCIPSLSRFLSLT